MYLNYVSAEVIKSIKFGTDGVRGIIDEDFNELIVASVVEASIRYFSKKRDIGKVIVGYDTRRKADHYAKIVVKICRDSGIEVSLTDRPTPTPVISWAVRYFKYDLAFQITASHNPPQYCGIKVIDWNGASISDEDAEGIMSILQRESEDIFSKVKVLEYSIPDLLINLRDPYVEYVVSISEKPRRKLKILFDPIYGTTIGFTDEILRRLGHEVHTIHDVYDQNFGGLLPCPEGENLKRLKDVTINGKYDLAISHDGDGDRIGVVTGSGKILTGNEILLLFVYEYSKTGKIRSVARTVATTSLVDKICNEYGIKLVETPVGIKYIAKLLIKGEVDIGGEESGGVAFRWHIPEKDGIYTASLISKIHSDVGIDNIIDEIYRKYGEPKFKRFKIEVKENPKIVFEKYRDRILEEIKNICMNINTIDGIKCMLQDYSWILIRPSGTEPVIRIYCEEYSQDSCSSVLEKIITIFQNIG